MVFSSTIDPSVMEELEVTAPYSGKSACNV